MTRGKRFAFDCGIAAPRVKGNLTADGTYTYTWNGENRVTQIEPTAAPVNGDRKLGFVYNYSKCITHKEEGAWCDRR